MESLMKSEIFFFVTTLSIVIVTTFFVIIGVYIIKIVKNFAHMSDALKKTVDDADNEIREISEQVRESPIFSFIFGNKKRKK